MKSERPPERDSTQGFGRGLIWGSFGRGNGRGFYSQGPLERNEIYRQTEEWSDPASEGRRRSNAPILSNTVDSQEPLPLLPHQKIDSLQTGAVLDKDLHL